MPFTAEITPTGRNRRATGGAADAPNRPSPGANREFARKPIVWRPYRGSCFYSVCKPKSPSFDPSTQRARSAQLVGGCKYLGPADSCVRDAGPFRPDGPNSAEEFAHAERTLPLALWRAGTHNARLGPPL